MDFSRDQLSELHTRSSLLGTVLVACDLLGYAVTFTAITWTSSWIAQLILAAFAAGFLGRLFMLGHDACHQSLTPSRTLNRVLGSVALLATLHPFSLWDYGHNRVHHRYTNQRGLDYVWEPLGPDEYARLSAFGRWSYRFYRTPIGHLFYYGVEIWWRRMFFPRPGMVGGYRPSYYWDLIPVGVWAVLGPVLLVALGFWWHGPQTSGEIVRALAFGWVLPLFIFNASMSSVIYLHHTHPRVVWVSGEAPAADAQLKGAVHVVMPGAVQRTLHHIMEHTAHHARPGIPLYRLADGQAVLEQRHPDDVIVERWSLRFHLDTLRRCKLFDLKSQSWVGYSDATALEPAARRSA